MPLKNWRTTNLYVKSDASIGHDLEVTRYLTVNGGDSSGATVFSVGSLTTSDYFVVERNDTVTSKSCIKIGDYWLFVDSSGTLMLSTTQPTSDASGHKVG